MNNDTQGRRLGRTYSEYRSWLFARMGNIAGLTNRQKIERAGLILADEEYRRRMRGGIDIPGLP